MAQKKKKLLTVDELWKIERIGAVSLSPDGAQAVCSVSGFAMDDNKSHSSLWLLSTFGGEPRRLTSCGEKDGQAAWSPKGDAIAFVAKREQQDKKDETPQLYVIAADGGEARRVSDFAPGVGAFRWFPDGKRIAFIAWVWPELRGTKAQAKRHKEFKDRKETGYATSEVQYRFWDENLPMGRVAHLHVVDVASGRITDLFEGRPFELPRADPDTNRFDIAPDGRHVVFAHDPSAHQQIENCHVLTELNLRSGKAETMLADKRWTFDAPRYSPDGAQIAFIASEQGRSALAPQQAALLPRGGRWKLLTDTWDHNVDAPLRWAADASALYFAAEDHGRRHLYRYAIGSRTASVAASGGWVQGFDVAGEVCVSVADAMAHPARVHVHRGGQAPQRLERFNDTLLAAFAFGACEDVRFKGARGDEVQMWLVYPPGFDRKAFAKSAAAGKKKLPVLHAIHGGPHAAAGDTFHYRWNNQVFAAQGYVVACVNYHGSSGFGQAFLESIDKHLGEFELHDVEAATDWLIKQTWVDRKRVFASGGSYGGYMVAWMNGHVKPGRYSAYVCHAGCYDWRAMFADDCYTDHDREFGGFYWDKPAQVEAQSPITFAKAMTTPTLVVHGAHDYRVPDAQGLAYYNTLKARGVEARLLWFPDENHWVQKPRNSRQWYREFFAWLAAHDAGRPHAAAPAKHKPKR